jgi:streptogramin lyase
VRAFADEECVAWHTPFPQATSQRPVAWTPGTYNPTTCQYDDQKVWSAACYGTPGSIDCEGATGIHVYLLDGDDGTVEQDLDLPDVDAGISFGPYGAAVDNVGNVWIYLWFTGKIMTVDLATLQHTVYDGGSYGITVDTKGRVWQGDAPARFDPATQQWQYSMLGGSGGTGIAQDLQNRIWAGTSGGVGWVDMETLATGDTIPLPEGNTIYRGIGVDIDGFIWAVPLGGTTAHRIDPNTYAVETYAGLNAPYTYSDFAGGQINNVTCNPPQG